MEDIEKDPFGSLELFCFDCSDTVLPGREGACQLLNVLLKAEGKFLRVRRGGLDNPVWEVDPEPLEKISQDGSFAYLDFAHPCLARTLLEPGGLRQFPQ